MNKKYKGEPPRITESEFTPVPESKIKTAIAFFKALGDPVRFKMILLLAQREDICTCEFQEIFGLSQSSISYHSRILLDAGIIKRHIYGPWSHYSLVDKELIEKIFSRCIR